MRSPTSGRARISSNRMNFCEYSSRRMCSAMLQHEHLLLLGIPVGAKTLEDADAELEPDRCDVDLAFVPGDHTVVRGRRTSGCDMIRAPSRRPAPAGGRVNRSAALHSVGFSCAAEASPVRPWLRETGQRRSIGLKDRRTSPGRLCMRRRARHVASPRRAWTGTTVCGAGDRIAQCIIESSTAYCPACSSPNRSGTCGCCTGSPDSSTSRFCSETYAMYVDDSFSARR